jgi:O-antigen ligase
MKVVGPFTWRDRSARDALPELIRRGVVWSLAFALAVYLALAGGGYDIVVRSEIGLIVWWFVVLGVLIGFLPRARIAMAGRVATVLLTGFLVWTWIGLGWSSSHELTLAEAGQVSTYLGVLLIGLCVISADTAGPLVNGLGCGIAAVSVTAVMSKLTPGLFPTDTAQSFYATPRLSYPFDYADGVGEYAAIGLPLLLYMATSGRTRAGRALATAGLQPVLLCLAMTVSRGGILAAVVGVIAFCGLMPDRIPRLPTYAITAAGIAALMAALLGRPALRDSIGVAPGHERHSMLVLLIVVMAAVALAQVLLLWLTGRIERPPWLQVSRRSVQWITAAIVAAVVALVVVAIGAGTVAHMWHDFKLWQPQKHSNQYFRLLSLAGSHRYQYWQVAWKAFESSPLHGIGSGTFRFYWATHTTHAEYIQNAHSLWFETLAETGIVGWLLLAGFFTFVVFGGIVRALRSSSERRALIGTATAGVIAFCAAASFDWVWQIGVVPMVTMLLAAVALLPSAERAEEPAASGPRAGSRRSRMLVARGVFAAGSLVALALIAIPLASTVALRASQRDYARGEIGKALTEANTARAIEPGAASPYLQRAELLEQLNDIKGASAAMAAALAREPTNSELWIVASRIAVESDQPQKALADFRRARALSPTETSFAG